MSKESIQEWWDENHIKNEKLWLAGSHLQAVLQSLNINAIKVNGNILLIGVGLGYEVQELKEYSYNLDVLDISQYALDRVKNITKNQYLTTDLPTLPTCYYDLVISNLVTQHMNDVDFNLQLKNVIRALKPNGLFAIQIAILDNDERPLTTIHSLESQKTGYVFRPIEKITQMVENNGGYLEWISKQRIFDHTPIKHQFIHIKRQWIKVF